MLADAIPVIWPSVHPGTVYIHDTERQVCIIQRHAVVAFGLLPTKLLGLQIEPNHHGGPSVRHRPPPCGPAIASDEQLSHYGPALLSATVKSVM